MIKKIGEFKHQFEQAQDVERLNMTHSFQCLVFHAFYYEYNNSFIVRNNISHDRLHVSIIKSKYPLIALTFELYHKHKRLPYYFDILFLDFNNKAITNHFILTQHILNDNMLIIFFRYEKKSICNHWILPHFFVAKMNVITYSHIVLFNFDTIDFVSCFSLYIKIYYQISEWMCKIFDKSCVFFF